MTCFYLPQNVITVSGKDSSLLLEFLLNPNTIGNGLLGGLDSLLLLLLGQSVSEQVAS